MSCWWSLPIWPGSRAAIAQALEAEQTFVDALLNKMAKTMELISKLDAQNTGINAARVGKWLTWLLFHMLSQYDKYDNARP